MARTLTKKQRGFVKDYLKTGNGTKAAKENYKVSNDLTARVIASENLTKPNIQKAIAEALPNNLLAERHLELLNKREIIIGHKKEDGTYEKIDNGPEVTAVSKGLDMAYKLKGSYAPEKSVNLNLNKEIVPETDIQALAEEVALKLKEKKLNENTN